MKKWNGKNKAVTFSFDDGLIQDIKLIDILNKYGLKGTFNLNSDFLGTKNELFRNNHYVRHDKIAAEDVKKVYLGHEVACHGCSHPDLRALSDKEIIHEIEDDRKILSDLCGYEVKGMAYPFGFYDDRVVSVIKNNTGIKYARLVNSTRDFNFSSINLLTYQPTIYFIEPDFEDIVDKFLTSNSESPTLLYIWGHGFELDSEYISWKKFEGICDKISKYKDIFFGTNESVLL